jgi:hypothetical protein
MVQAIWLKGSHDTYVNKKFMLLVTFTKLRKPINWAQIMLSNLHSRLCDLSIVIKPKKKDPKKEMKFATT